MKRFTSLCLIALAAAFSLVSMERDLADSHGHWEHIVHRLVEDYSKRYPVEYEPKIIDVQNYYKNLLNEDWEKRDQQKVISGRYIVMFSPEAGDHHLDRTMELLRYVDEKSRQNQWDLRAADFDPIRHVGKGFTATLSSNVVRMLWKNPLVNSIEQDVVFSPFEHDATAAGNLELGLN